MKIPAHYIFAAALLVLGACSSEPEVKPEPEPVELKSSDAPSIDTPEALLFHEAKRLYRAGLYTIAVDSFESLRINYPLSPYVEFAELKIADARFELRDFALAATSYEDFAKNHPASPAIPYVLMRAGSSYRMTNRGVGRDIAPLEKAHALYTRLLKEYPASTYATQAKVLLDETNQGLADHQKFVTDFYRHQANEKAVAAREKYFTEKFKDLETQRAAVQAEASPVVRTATRSLENPGILAAVRADSESSSEARASQAQSPEQIRQGLLIADAQEILTHDVQRVQCRDDKIFLYLREPLNDQAFFDRNKTLLPQAGKISVAIPNVVARATVLDCFGKQDLSISSQGELSLESQRSWDLMGLDNPPRLLLIQK